MACAKFGHLARPTRGRILVPLAAGLRVIEGAEAVLDRFYLIELRLIGLVGRVVYHTVAVVTEAGGCFAELLADRRQCEAKSSGCQDDLHGSPPFFRLVRQLFPSGTPGGILPPLSSSVRETLVSTAPTLFI